MKIRMCIPAKATSERLENKNLREINGKSLVEIACERGLACKNIDSVHLDTESEKIIEKVDHLTKNGLKIIKRPRQLATNNIGANELLVYALHTIDECDLLLQTFPTSPLISAKTIDKIIEDFLRLPPEYDSFFSVTPLQEYYWNDKSKPVNFDIKALPNSADLETINLETHGIYGVYTHTLLKEKTRVGKRPYLAPIPKLEAIDIDTEDDYIIAKSLLEGAVHA